MSAAPPASVRAAGLALLSQMKDKQNSPPGSPRSATSNGLIPSASSYSSTAGPRFMSPPPPSTSTASTSPRTQQTSSTSNPSTFQLAGKRGSGINGNPNKWSTSTSPAPNMSSPPTSTIVAFNRQASAPIPTANLPLNSKPVTATTTPLPFSSTSSSAPSRTAQATSPMANKITPMPQPGTMFGSKAPPPAANSTKFPPYEDSTITSNSSASSAYSNGSEYSNGGVYNTGGRKIRSGSIGSTVSTASSSSHSAAVVNIPSNNAPNVASYNTGGGYNGNSGGFRSSQNVDSSVPISEYRPRVTIFERQEFKQNAKQGETCGVDGCWQPAEINGMCIKHYYAYPHDDSNGVGNYGQGSYGGNSPGASPTAKKGPPSLPAGFLGVNRSNASPTTSSSSSSASSSKMTPMEERMKLAEELVTTEKTYIDNLQSLKAGFVLRLKESANLGKPILSPTEISSIFLNVEDILDLNMKFFKDLQKLSQFGQLLSPELGNTLKSYAPFFRLYIQYVNHYDEANRSILTLREKNKDFDFYVKLNEACEKQRIQDFLILPVQRIPRYLLLLRGILKLTDQTEVLHAAISAALNDLEKVANEINSSLHDREARQRVIEVQNHLEGCTIPLVTPTRYHCKDGALHKKYANAGFKLGSFKKYWFFLFNDMLMYTTVPNMFGNCKLKYILPLNNMSVLDIPDNTIPKINFVFELTGSVKALTVHASSQQEKQSWINSINEQIGILKSKMSTLKVASGADPLLNEFGNDDDDDAVSESSSAVVPPSPTGGPMTAGYGGFGQGQAYATDSQSGYGGGGGMRFPIAGMGGGPPPRPY